MVTDANSVHERVTRLCEKILKQHTATHPLQRRSSSAIVKDLRALSYGILLNKSHAACSCVGDSEGWDAVAEILAYSYKLHQCQLTAQAVKLYELVNNLLSASWGGNSTVEAILLFLANLAGEAEDCAQDNSLKCVSILHKPVNSQILKIPSDIHVKPYEEFSPQMFELPIRLDTPKNSTGLLLNQEPGMGLALLGKFGALVKLRQRPLVEFHIFPDLTEPRGLAIPKEASPQEQQDEGYVSPSQENAMTGSCVSNGVESLGSKVWEMALKVDLAVPRTWGTIGCLDRSKEKPFFTESRIDSVQKVWKVTRGHMFMYMNMSTTEHMLLTDLKCKQLIQDLKHLLIGVPSRTFIYNQEENGFVMKSNVCVEGVTPETLHSFCEDFLVSGTCCLRLRKLVERNLMTGSHVQEGLMFQALCGSIHRYLQFYRSAVMMLSEEPVLTRLRQQVDGLHIQMTSLGHLCKVHPNTSQEDGKLPEGVALLAYLYQEICKVTRKDVACILYSALHACCQVYFSFLEKWIFEGSCQDAYTEFFIQEQPDLMTCRQRDYWSRGYYMLEEAIPGFLKGLEVPIFHCGKALNLLKLCNPQDTLCVVLQSGHPSIQCCLHSEGLQQLEAECLSYQHRAFATCGEPLDLRRFFQCIKEEEQALQSAVQTAQQASLQKLKLEHDMKVSQALSEKRAQLAVLKEQMEMAEARRVAEKKQQLEEDEQRAQEAAELEQEMARRIELEKADLVRYYSALSEVADKRRQHAEWRIERMKLQEKRLELKSDGTEAVTTIRSPNNNEDLQDINSNLPDMNVLNSLHLEGNTEESIINIDTQNSTKASNTVISNYKTKISDIQNNIEASDRQINITNSKLHTNSSDVCLTYLCDSSVDESAISEKSTSCMSEDQIDEHVRDNKSSKVETNPKQNKRGNMSKQTAEVILEPHSSPTDDVKTAAIGVSESHTTVLAESLGTDKLTENALPNTNIGRNERFSYRLPMSLEDAPLVNITDSVVPPVKDAAVVSALDVGAADMSSVNITLQKSILIPLKIQTSLVNSALLKFFLQDKRLLSHLHSLRSHFFLLDGEFGRNMTSMLFERMYQVACPVDLLNCVTLNSILSKALTRPDPNMDRLSFDVKYIPPHFSFSLPSLLDCIMLQYKVDWPLNIIFTDAALHKYNEIFAFLLRLRRISWVLEEDFHHLKREAQDKPGLLRSPQYHHLQLYRHEMTHFVHALQNYVTAAVLQASWVEFLQNLQNAHTLDDLYRMHAAYVKTVFFRCLLNKQSTSIQKTLMDTLKMILKFHGQIRSQAWQLKPGTSQYEHPRFSTLAQMCDCFHNLAVFTFKFATKLANTGYEPHLLDLLQMLNMNGFYPEHV